MIFVCYHFILWRIFLNRQELSPLYPPRPVKLFKLHHFFPLCATYTHTSAQTCCWVTTINTSVALCVWASQELWPQGRRDIMTGCRGVFNCPTPPPPHLHPPSYDYLEIHSISAANSGCTARRRHNDDQPCQRPQRCLSPADVFVIT